MTYQNINQNSKIIDKIIMIKSKEIGTVQLILYEL